MAETTSSLQFGAHQNVLLPFDQVVANLGSMTRDPACQRLTSQQITSTDLIASNIEEGYGRGSKKDYAHFLIIARGPGQETRRRYGRSKHWLPTEVIAERTALCDEISSMLTATIQCLKLRGKK